MSFDVINDVGIGAAAGAVGGMIEVDNNRQLEPGDKLVIKLRQKFGGALLLAMKLQQLEDDPRFDVTGWTYQENGVDVHIKVTEHKEVYEAGIPITPGVIIAAIIGISSALVTYTIYLVPGEVSDAAKGISDTLETSGGKTLGGITLAGMAVAAMLIYSLIKK